MYAILLVMGRPPKTSQIHAEAFSFSKPEALERDIVKDQQTRFDEETILWGDLDDSLPIRILQAVNQSPTTTSCLGKVADYMQGSGFSDPGLMKMVIDQDGTTLWDYHARMCDYMAKLEGFSTRFTFNREGNITQAFMIGAESCRFVKPSHTQSRKINKIKYNPYWGTALFSQNDTKTYNLWEPNQTLRYQEITEALEAGVNYSGQVYFFGNPRAPYKFYPVPKYWSGKEWIYVDGQTQIFIKKLLDNGFFESALITMIGDPTQPSKNPKYQKKKTGTDNVVRTEQDGTTVGQEFSEMMSKSFSGSDKAGKAMVLWAMNKDSSPTVQAFPTNTNFDTLNGTVNNAIRGITIATEVQAILANLPQQGSSLGSDGDSMRMAVELMQARVKEPQNTLEQFYNTILLPNMAEKTGARVKIVNHTPLSNQIQVPDKVWEWMNDEEKAAFVRANVPVVTVIRTPTAPAPVVDPNAPPPEEAKATGALKDLKMSEVNRVTNIVNKVAKGKLTRAQGVQFLKDYGFTDEQIKDWLPEEEGLV